MQMLTAVAELMRVAWRTVGGICERVAGVLVAWRPWRRTDETPLKTLQTRFARGDIDQQEFDRLRHTLQGSA